MSKRIEYPGLNLSNGDAENYFNFYDTRMRRQYLQAVDYVLKNIGDEGKVLDIGCGAGVFGVLLCDKTEYFHVSGLERSGLLVRIGEAISSRFGYAQRISLKTWNDNSMPFPDDEFDAVVGILSMNRWGNCRDIFGEIERVRKSRSVVFVTDFRRELSFPPFFMYALKNRMAAGKDITADLVNAFKASYRVDEIQKIMDELGLSGWRIDRDGRFLTVSSSPLVVSAES